MEHWQRYHWEWYTEKPFKTIDKAIKISPSSGQIVIKILDKDDHYVVGMNDAMVANVSNYTPGPVYASSDSIVDEPVETISYKIDVGIRTVIIEPYNNPSVKRTALTGGKN